MEYELLFPFLRYSSIYKQMPRFLLSMYTISLSSALCTFHTRKELKIAMLSHSITAPIGISPSFEVWLIFSSYCYVSSELSDKFMICIKKCLLRSIIICDCFSFFWRYVPFIRIEIRIVTCSMVNDLTNGAQQTPNLTNLRLLILIGFPCNFCQNHDLSNFRCLCIFHQFI